MTYRPEIDGLRAIAVLLVVLYHAGISAFAGGFVGVDIFFVVSGYLIMGLIVEQLQRGTFNLLEFYERRARRILPALLVMMACCIPVAHAWMLPDDLENFGQSLVASTVAANNILLLWTSGYWSQNAEFKPLLHTWSLGLEEQFYLFAPAIFILVWTAWRRRGLFCVVLGFGIASAFSAAAMTFADHTAAADLMLPTRAWSLLLGCTVVLLSRQPSPANQARWGSPVLVVSGLALITCSVATGVLVIAWPNQASSAVAALGTALILAALHRGRARCRALAWTPLVSLGVISYSVYLWHQPLLAFARVYSIAPPDTTVMLGLATLSIGIGYLSWRWVEQPFRNRDAVSLQKFAVVAIPLSVAIAGWGYHLHHTHGLPERLYRASAAMPSGQHIAYNEAAFRFKLPGFSSAGTKPRVLVIGNSFARDFINMVIEEMGVEQLDLIYRDDLDECLYRLQSSEAKNWLEPAQVIVLAADGYETDCIDANLNFANVSGKVLFYIGPKHFGYNLNWVTRQNPDKRGLLYNELTREVRNLERHLEDSIPTTNYLSLLAPIIVKDRTPITDEHGNLLTTDRRHFTRSGAIFFGAQVLRGSALEAKLKP